MWLARTDARGARVRPQATALENLAELIEDIDNAGDFVKVRLHPTQAALTPVSNGVPAPLATTRPAR